MTQYLDVTHFSLGEYKDLVAKTPALTCADYITEKTIFGEGRSSVMLLQHNDLFSWISEVPLICDFCNTMQAKWKVPSYPFVIFHKAVFATPIIRDIARHYVGNAVSSYDEIVNVLNTVPGAFVATCPEGSNCNFTYDHTIADFSTLGLLKAALSTDANLVTITMRQDAPLSKSVNIPFFDKLKSGARGIKIPFFKRVRVTGVFDLIEKPVSAIQFNAMTPDAQYEIVNSLAKNIRERMISRYDSIAHP